MSPVIHQVVSVLQSDDAVGNEVRMIRDGLRGRGVGSEIFVAVRSGNEPEPVHDLDELLEGSAPDAVLYHFATASRATGLLAQSSLPLVLVYHNVTPAHWFWGIDRAHHEACAAAHDEVASLADRALLALGHSQFTRRELTGMGFPRAEAFPLLVAEDVPPAPSRDAPPALLSVGRIAPNKCIEDMIRLHAAVRRDVPGVQLWIAGDGSRLPRYTDALHRLVARLDTGASVRWLGPVSRQDLLQRYRDATLVVSMSEHEGFAGTLLEAMRAGTPVVAYGAGAVPETVGHAGVLLPGKNIAVAAQVVARLLQDAGHRAELAARGQRRAEELGMAGAFATLVQHVARVAPRAAAATP